MVELYKDCEGCNTIKDFPEYCTAGRRVSKILKFLKIVGDRPRDCSFPHNDIPDVETQLLYRLFQKALDITSYKLSEDVELK